MVFKLKFRNILLFLIFPLISYSQSGLESILLAVEDDSKKIFNRYMNPLMKGAIYSSNSGWYNTAKVHSKLGVDLSFRLNTTFVPSSDQIFSISDLENITSNAKNLPTIIGENKQENLLITIPADGLLPELKTTVKAPKGIKSKLPLGGVPAPVLQLGIGIPFDTEIIIRYSPEYHRKGIDMSLKGLGIKHNLLQYFEPIDKFPLNISAFASFSKMEIDYDIQSFSSIKGSGQIAEFSLNNYNLLLLASLDILVINFYFGFGITGGNSSFKMIGRYDLEYQTQSNVPVNKTIIDPIDMNFDTSNFQTTIGAKYKFLIFSAYIDFSFQQYKTLSVGISTNFR
ncbi:MAG: hypothetical protein CMC38_03100 [Flavobacteriaceae bacterium]|nr:hypothetical protein [Flavobacteriaceae bacterium]|tara:strand:+ start:3046 stop:4068 length:1023 start_codon:yes stop_codon:yes gene_type:complete